MFGFLGPNGAGKSTTQKLLIGLLRGHGGQALVWGKAPLGVGEGLLPTYRRVLRAAQSLPEAHRRGESAVLRFAVRRTHAGSEGLLGRSGLADAADTQVGKYSKGMLMRLTFARSLINDPELLFLDEPTSGLDPVNARIVKDMILDLKARGRTIFLTTHDMATADELCDRVAFVVDGQSWPWTHRRSSRSPEAADWFGCNTATCTDGLATAEFPMDGLADNHEFHTVLRNHRVETIHSKEASLDDVFVEVTGRSLS